MAISRLFIANRGEIAVRIIRACKQLGITTIQGYSEGDADMMAVKLADEAVCLGGAQSRESYLNIPKVVAAIRATKSDAVHPGYGFLSESPEFARKIEVAGIVFVGPDAATIERMGDKVEARKAAQAAGVPVVPGSKGRLDSVEEAAAVAAQIGYPVMMKAAAGGGGRGIRVAASEEELRKLAPQARQEAEAAFGDGGLYLERAVRSPRHIEVQILGDGKNAIHCYERECSLQRRRQKVWEEAGAVCLDEETREALCASAVALAAEVHYRGAGTLEYLYDEASNEFFFIEMNTRIQVEHPVSEMITGVDLVQEMIRVCGGSPLSISQDDVKRDGHSIEVRINAEDPHMQFMPWPGKLERMSVPEEPGFRFDHFMYEGYQIPPFYDSLIGKVVVHAPTRKEAIEKLKRVLNAVELRGLKTTIPLHLALADDPSVLEGRFHTQWLEPWLEAGNLKPAEGDAA